MDENKNIPIHEQEAKERVMELQLEKKYTKSFIVYKVLIYVLLVFLVIIGAMPFLILFSNATRSTYEIQQSFGIFPSKYLIDNFRLFREYELNLMQGFINSTIIALGSAFLSVSFSALTAYAFTAYEFKGKKFLFSFIIFLILIPTQLSLAGFIRFMFQIGLYDSYVPLIIPAVAAPATVFFMRQYLEGVYQPELIDSARIDGAGELQIFFRIMVPIMKPALATMGIFAIVASWNNLITPRALITTEAKYTMPMIVRLLTADIYKVEYGALYLGIALTILPLVISYIFLSRYIIRGLTLGGVKE